MVTKLNSELINIAGETESFPSEIKLTSKSEYRAVLKKHLSDELFSPDLRHVFLYATAMSIYLLGIYTIVQINILPLSILSSIIMGIALTSLTFFLHDLFHGSIIKSKLIAYVFGLSIGIFNLFAPLFWQRVHNLHLCSL